MSENSKTNNSGSNSKNEALITNTTIISSNISKLCDRLEETKKSLERLDDNEYEDIYNRVQFYFSTIINETKLKFYEQVKEYKLQSQQLKESNQQKDLKIEELSKIIKDYENKLNSFKDNQFRKQVINEISFEINVNRRKYSEKKQISQERPLSDLKIKEQPNRVIHKSLNKSNKTLNTYQEYENTRKNNYIYSSLSKSKGKLVNDFNMKNLTTESSIYIQTNNITCTNDNSINKTRNNKQVSNHGHNHKYYSFADLNKINTINSNYHKNGLMKNIFCVSNSSSNFNLISKKEGRKDSNSKEKHFSKDRLIIKEKSKIKLSDISSANRSKCNTSLTISSDCTKNKLGFYADEEKRKTGTINVDELRAIEENPNEVRVDTDNKESNNIPQSPSIISNISGILNLNDKSKKSNNINIGFKSINAESIKQKLNQKLGKNNKI